MNEIFLFTDGSVDIATNIGYGAYVMVTNFELPVETLKKQVKTKRFENTSSTRLELETLLWALNDISATGKKITIYTDSQNIAGLTARRLRLEQNNYHSKNNRLMNNHDLYREFFSTTDSLDCEFIKVRGHQPTIQKDKIHRLFTLVDKASRKALRNK